LLFFWCCIGTVSFDNPGNPGFLAFHSEFVKGCLPSRETAARAGNGSSNLVKRWKAFRLCNWLKLTQVCLADQWHNVHIAAHQTNQMIKWISILH
jgi:hypothetical protein